MREIMARFHKYMEYKGLNDNQVTIQCGLSQGLLSQARRGKSDLGKKTIDVILKNYQDINRIWLLTGEGEMLNAEIPETKIVDRGVPLVPLINLDVRGGYDDNIEGDNEFAEKLIPWPGARKDDFAVEVSGTSMMPTIPPGSRLLLRRVDGWQHFLELNQLYVFELKDYRRILKNAQRSDKGDDYVTLESYNPATPDQDLPRSFINRVYKVVGQITNYGF